MNTSSKKSHIVAWTVWMIASIFYAYQYILRVLPNIMLDDIMKQFDIGAATFGQFSGLYYIGYALMHLPIGIMLDRYGPKKVMAGSILLTVLGLMPLIFSNFWVYPIVGRVLIGIGSSAAILGVFKVIRMTFSEKRFPRMLSISVMIGLIGAIYGGGPVDYMREVLGYQTVIRIFAFAGLALAVATYLIVPNINTADQRPILSDVKEVFSNKRVILSCLCAGLMVGPLEGFADVWGTAFLKQSYHFEGSVAASLPSLIFVGMCFGSPVLNWIAEKVGNYLATVVGAGAIMAACFILMLITKLNPTALSISFVLVGICCAYQILAIYKASTFVRPQVAGLTTAVANMIIMTFGYCFHTVIGSVIKVMGGPMSSSAMTCGMIVIPIALCIGTLGFVALTIQEKQPARA